METIDTYTETLNLVSNANRKLGEANHSTTEIGIEAFGASTQGLLDQIEQAQVALNRKMLTIMAAQNELTDLKFHLQRQADEA